MNNEISAPVFNIQTYCIHDGPGIRTTVFLKGCPLRCIWCANPESNESYPQLMTYSNKCTACGLCIPECPNEAISIFVPDDGKSKPFAVTDRDKCVNCGKCVSVCPSKAREIAGKDMTVGEIISEVLKDKLFLDESGGGMTVSGGEALVHHDFCEALFKAAKDKGIHTAIETTCFASRAVIDQVFQYVDLGLIDIKHMNSEIHKKLTGVPNEQILDNIKHVNNELGIPVIIRVPTVPDHNGDTGNIAATAKFVKNELGEDVKIHLLPYHRLGESKEESLGRLIHRTFTVPENSYMEMLKDIVSSYGVDVQIGG
ncbi:MAG: glycyl-radical enzyme activating protein [Lachnospiraceae bacterium]|nr:glycyl-radical enzyme activating protein [Lachnospiraceae bacterium]